MVKYTLVTKKDAEYGNMGFYFEGTQYTEGMTAASEGMLIAHDLIEHSDVRKIGTIGDELKALGAIWYVRGQFGELRRDRTGSNYSISENIACEIVNMGRMFVQDNRKFHAPIPIVRTCGGITYIEETIEDARRLLRSELDEEYRGSKRINEYLDAARQFMIKGWQDAGRRYKRIGANGANTLFWKIAKEADRYVKEIEWDGEEFELNVIYKTKKVNMRRIEADY